MRRLTSTALIAANYMIFFSVMFLLSTCWERKKGLSNRGGGRRKELSGADLTLFNNTLPVDYLCVRLDYSCFKIVTPVPDWGLWVFMTPCITVTGEKNLLLQWDTGMLQRTKTSTLVSWLPLAVSLSVYVSTVFCLIKTNVFVKYWDA